MPFDTFQPIIERPEFHKACSDFLTVFQDMNVLRSKVEELRNGILSRGHNTPLSVANDFGDIFDMVEDSLDVMLDAEDVFIETLGEEIDSLGSWVREYIESKQASWRLA